MRYAGIGGRRRRRLGVGVSRDHAWMSERSVTPPTKAIDARCRVREICFLELSPLHVPQQATVHDEGGRGVGRSDVEDTGAGGVVHSS